MGNTCKCSIETVLILTLETEKSLLKLFTYSVFHNFISPPDFSEDQGKKKLSPIYTTQLIRD